jgi:hypothetical protein
MGSSKVENEPVGKTLPRDRYHLLSRICDQLKPGHSRLRHRRSVSEWAVWSDRVVLLPPPAVSVVGDADPTYCLTDALATRNGNLDLPKFPYDLLRAVSFPWHLCLPSKRPVSDFSTGYVRGGQVTLALSRSAYRTIRARRAAHRLTVGQPTTRPLTSRLLDY